MKNGVAVSSGTFKGVFAHGVLAQFEKDQFSVGVYAGCSSSLISCSLAAVRLAGEIGVDYWLETIDLARTNIGMSQVIKRSIAKYGLYIREKLFGSDISRLMIATSYVNNETAAKITQGSEYKKLGKRLLIASLRRDSSWVDENLVKQMFDTHPKAESMLLSDDNYDEVAYASTRMLHAWDEAAWISDKPYIDGSYTCSFPVFELVNDGCADIVAIGVETQPLYTSIFKQVKVIDDDSNGVRISIISPEVDLNDFGVDYFSATDEGLRIAYRHGMECAKKYLDKTK